MRHVSEPLVNVQNPFDASRLDIPIANEGQTGYCGVGKRMLIDFDRNGRYLVVIYSAFCAYGLYGPEQNGIAILDETRGTVLLDRHCEQTSGYFGPSDEQKDEYDRIRKMTWSEFQEFVNRNERARYMI